jgi:membrane protein DedA with SNARE-associated domain
MSTSTLPGIFGALEPTLKHYGYLAVGFLVTIEDFGIPVPGETVLIAAALYAGAGKMNIVIVGLVGFFAAVIGDNIGFAIGHFGGRALALRYGKYIFLTPERLDRAEAFFERHGGKIIVVARFIEGLRQANGIVAGITGMHWRKFVFFNAIGAALWVGVWVSVGYLAGNHITTIYDQITRYSLYVLIAAAVAVVAFIAWHLRRRARRRAARPGRPSGVPGIPNEAHRPPPEIHEIPNEDGLAPDRTHRASASPEPGPGAGPEPGPGPGAGPERPPGSPAAAGDRNNPPDGQESS